MTPDQIEGIARAIEAQQVHGRWWFYVIWFGITLIAAAAGAWLGAYFKKRGESFATKADFDELLDQAKKTTSAVDEVRTGIAHGDWTVREWKTLRRIKGEELLAEAEKAKHSLAIQGTEYLFSEMKLYEDLGSRVYNLALLYFPEALVSANHFAALLSQGTNLLLDIRAEMQNEGVPISESAVRTRRLHEVREHGAKLEAPLNEIRETVRTCLWNAYALPEYVHDQEHALRVLSQLPTPTPPPAQTPSAPSPASPRS